ncbi:MAG: adenylyl-sulfate kinase [Pseudobdellovibrio sp.]
MSLRVAMVGHVDHGKSTLIGRLLSDTGQVLPDKVDKVKNFCSSTQRKYEYAFLLDALEEEQLQGITIDTTEVRWSHDNSHYLFIDTPGHKEFIKNMIAGASKVKVVIMLVDAVEGITDSFKRQIQLISILGNIEHIIIAVNKMDLVNWSETIWSERKGEIEKFIAQVSAKMKFQIIPISAWHGENLLVKSDKMPWYSSLHFASALKKIESDIAEQNKKKSELPLRFFIQDTYKFESDRIYVGRVESGLLEVGQSISFGENASARVLKILGQKNNQAKAGASEAVGVVLDQPLFLNRGRVGFGAQAPQKAAQIEADVFWLNHEPLQIGDLVQLKIATQKFDVIVEKVLFEIKTDDLTEQKDAASLKTFGRLVLRIPRPQLLDENSHFVISQDGVIQGGGKILKLYGGHVAQVKKKSVGQVLWMTGHSGAGKSTLARELEKQLLSENKMIAVLDGDEVRKGLCRDLGFSSEDRLENIRRVAEVAKLFSEKGFTVICALITPQAEQRALAKKIIGGSFSEVFIDCPIQVCEERDVKGLYRKARSNEIQNFTGVSAN